MSELVDRLASDTGLDPVQAEKGLGALLAFIKEHFGGDILDKLRGVLPNAHDLVEDHEQGQQAAQPGGLLGKLTSLATSIFGAQAEEASKMLARFSQAGFNAEEMTAFLPKALEMLEKHLPPEVFEKLKALMPGPAAATTAGE